MAIENELINETILISAGILLYLTAIYFAIKVGRKLGRARFWNLIILGLVFIIGRRITALLLLWGIGENNKLIILLDRTYFSVLISLCFALAMHELYNKIKTNKETK